MTATLIFAMLGAAAAACAFVGACVVLTAVLRIEKKVEHLRLVQADLREPTPHSVRASGWRGSQN